MENASKALIIAGSVLVAIVLISIGIYIVGSVKPLVNVAGEAGDKLAIQTYNSTFTKYIGTKKGATIIKLLQDVITNNNVNSNIISVSFEGEIYSNNIGILQAEISPAGTYKITINDSNYDDNTGKVTQINITNN